MTDCPCVTVMPRAKTDTGGEFSAVTIICGLCDRTWHVTDITESAPSAEAD